MPRLFHAVAATFIAGCLWFADRRPDAYGAAMQEDRIIEWLTVFVFAAAGVIILRRALRERRVFDGLVALFLLFVAGEEMSWGQRVLGLTPPAVFLEHNTQQELNVHNFAGLFGGPKEPFTLVLIGFAIVMPLVALIPRGRALLARIGATPPSPATIPWFLAAIVLFVWYPVSFTGEWTELLAGSAFLMTSGVRGRRLAALTGAGALFAVALTAWSARGTGDRSLAQCATRELQVIAATLDASALGGDAHRRVWTFGEDGRVDMPAVTASLDTVACNDGDARTRRRYAVDPWGTAYWIRVERDSMGTAATVYTFGPNRRRDVDARDRHAGDDLWVRRAF